MKRSNGFQRVINGRIFYTSLGGWITKGAAQDEAKRMREQGRLARITQGNYGGDKIWKVWFTDNR